MLLQLPDECKQQIWDFFDFRELCRASCIAHGVSRGVDTRRVWKRRALELLQDEQAQMRVRTGLLGHRLQRGFATRNLLSTGDAPPLSFSDAADNESALDALDWHHWYRDTYKSLTVFTSANAGFTTGVNELQELKADRAALKEALQCVKNSAHADKRVRRVQMHCVRYMNRSHRRRTAIASSQQAHVTQLSRAELTDELQTVEAAVQIRGKELFTLRSRALKSLHKLNKQLAEGARMVSDLQSQRLVV